jgi:uncharacterized lipoprotein YehR (DUF1307 family)
MKTNLLIVAAGALALSLGACEKKEEAPKGALDNATKAAATGADAVKDAAAKGADAVKDAAAKGAEAVKDAGTKGAEAVAGAWEAAKTAFTGDNTKTFDGFKTQVADLSKKVEALPAIAKEPAKKVLDEVNAKIGEGEKLLASLKGAGESDWKAISTKVSDLIPGIKSGLEKLTGMLPK